MPSHTVGPDETWESIAEDYFRDASMAKIIADFNGKRVDRQPSEGDEIQIPEYARSRAFHEEGLPVIELEVPAEPPELEITAVDDQFVPATNLPDEQLRITYTIANCADEDVTIRVKSQQYSGDHVVWERQLTDNEKQDGQGKQITWNGQANCAQGDLSGNRLIIPLYSPYEVELECGDTTSDPESFSVLYHSIALSMGTYVADPAHPPQRINPAPNAGDVDWADHIRWVQYRLNELGYFAGPVDGNKGPQTDRAIRRYTYTMPGVDETDDARSAQFLNALAANERARTLFEHPEVIADPASHPDSRIYIDHNYFYYHEAGQSAWKNQNRADMHAYLDWVKLDRFEFPIEASVKLVSRDDDDGTDDGVESPGAVGPVEIEWKVLDPPENTNQAPTHNAPLSPSKGRDYITLVLQQTAVNHGDATDSQDNCPERLGGFRGPGCRYFRSGNALAPFTCRHNPAAPAPAGPAVGVVPAGAPPGTPAGAPALPRAPDPGNPAEPNLGAGPQPNQAVNPVPQYFSEVLADPTNNPPKLGKTGVLFQGSHVAGDNYVITARLSLENRPNRDALKQLHVDLSGAASFDQIQALAATTGTMTVWRRRRIEAVVNWRGDNQAINWNEIEQAYAEAFCEITHAATVVPIANIFNTVPLQQQYTAQFQQCFPALCGPAVQLQFSNQQLCPIQMPVQGGGESSVVYKARIQAIKDGLNSQNSQLDLLTWVGQRVRQHVNQASPSGLILLCYNLVTQDVAINCSRIKFIFTFRRPRLMETFRLRLPEAGLGLPNGIAAVGRWRRAQWKDRFFFSHEIAHCCYLMHSWTGAVAAGGIEKPGHHDKHDLNCIMCYPFTRVWRGVRNINVARGAGANHVMHFCGKCLLKLRGWKVVDPQAQVLPIQSQALAAALGAVGGYNAANDLDDAQEF